MIKVLRIFILILLLKGHYAFGQLNNAMYFMPEIYQTKYLNPAYQQSCKVIIGLPILSSIYLNYTNTNLSYNRIFNESTEIDPHILDPQNFIQNKLSKKNYIFFDAHFQLFSLGIKTKKADYSFDIIDKVGFWFGFPRELLGLPLFGNGHPDYMESSFNGLGIDFDYYREYAFGYATQINEQISVGGRVKVLFGKLNIYTKKLDIGLNTDEEDFSWTLYANSSLNMSLPLNIDQDPNGQISTSLGSLSPIELLLNRKNTGGAIDAGVIYNMDEKISAYASIVDFGMIRWTSNVTNINQEGEFTFSGVDNLLNIGQTDFSEILDSLQNEFLVGVEHKNYMSYLPLKIYLGGTYQLTNKLTFGALNRNMIYNSEFFPSFTLSAKYQLFKSMKVSLAYSIINSSYNNIGLTWYLGRKGLQFYISQQNNLFLPINGLIYSRTEKISKRILGFQKYNIRFGFNIIFGCKENKKVQKSLQCPWMRRLDPEWLKNKEYYPSFHKKPSTKKRK
ncbi:DUF5723 family protein [Bacteroidota bacterium]